MHASIHLSISKSYFISRFQLQTCILDPHQVFIFMSFKTCFNMLLFHLFWYILTYKSKYQNIVSNRFEILKPVTFASELSTGVPGPSRPFWRISKNHFHIKNLCMSVRHEERSKVVSITFDRPTWSYFFQKAQNILLLVERSKVDSINFRPPYIEMIFPETRKIGALSRAVESWQYNFRPPYIRVIFPET